MNHALGGVRRILALATAVMVLLCWPLWVDGRGFPRVPFVAVLAVPSRGADWAVSVGLLGGVAGTGLARRWRPWFAASLGCLVWLVLHDQHRFQPWAYQYAITGLFLAALPGRSALMTVRSEQHAILAIVACVG